jgi:hypothetical protein
MFLCRYGMFPLAGLFYLSCPLSVDVPNESLGLANTQVNFGNEEVNR